MKIVKFVSFQIILGLFIYGCSNNIMPQDLIKGESTAIPTKNEPTVIPTGVSASTSVPTDIIKVYNENFVDKNNLNSPSCQNYGIITGNIYSNDSERTDVNDFIYLNDYLEQIKSEKSLENVEVTYNGKTIKTNDKGAFSIPMSEVGDSLKIKFSKQGYVPFEHYYISNTCLFHIGLSPLYPDELAAKEMKLISKHYSSEFPSTPDFFTFIKNKEFDYIELSYFIVDNEEKAKKVNFTDKIDFSKEIVLMIASRDPFGFPPAIIDTAMETDNNFILSSHKTRYLNLIPIERKFPPVGDDFKIKFQSIILPKSSKEIIVYLNKDKKLNLTK